MRVFLVLAMALAAACGACAAAPEPRPYLAALADADAVQPPASGRSLLQEDWQVELLGLVNDARTQAGVPPLCLNAKLSNAAQVGRTAGYPGALASVERRGLRAQAVALPSQGH